MSETVTSWSVEIFLSEIDGHSHAEARLHTGVEPGLTASGRARLSDRDTLDVAEIGFELAAARALRALSDALMRAAEGDVEAISD